MEKAVTEAMEEGKQKLCIAMGTMEESRQKLTTTLSSWTRSIDYREHRNALVHVQGKIKGLEVQFRSWLAKQPTHVEAAVSTVTGAAQGAAIGGFMSVLSNDLRSALPSTPNASPEGLAAQALSSGPLVQARNFAVMTGTNAGIASMMKRIRGKDDVEGSMMAAFGSGAMFTLVSGMGGGSNQVVNAVSTGIFFALIQGGLYKFGQKFWPQRVEDTNLVLTKDMLKDLGYETYMKNFKNGKLNDQTLPLLTDSALREIRIPPGPRLIILDHIQRDLELKKGGK